MRFDFKGSAFNGAVAVVAATAVAFAAFAMPDYQFTQLINFSGLPSILPAAAPPLGVTARLGVMAIGALVAFLAVWLLLRTFDPPAVHEYCEDDGHDDFFDGDWDPQRVRRADTHPDAPTRRPIFAAQDLGEPFEDSQTEDSRKAEEIQPREECEEEQGDQPGEAADNATAGPGPVPFRRLVELRLEAGGDEGTEPCETQDPPIARGPDQALADDAEHIALRSHHHEQDEPQPETDSVDRLLTPLKSAGPEAETLPSGHADEKDLLELRGEDEEEPAPTRDLAARLPLAKDDGQSISSLLSRLDVGLGSCEWPLPPASASTPRRLSGQRLSSMIDDLQKMASRSR